MLILHIATFPFIIKNNRERIMSTVEAYMFRSVLQIYIQTLPGPMDITTLPSRCEQNACRYS